MDTTIYDILKKDNAVEILKHLDNQGVLKEMFPELTALKKSSNESHKDNFVHTLGVLSNVIENNDCHEMRLVAILHDLGKAKTMRKIDDKWTFHSHEEVSAKMLTILYSKYSIPMDTFEYVHTITLLHGRPKVMCLEEITDSAIRRLNKEAGIYFKDLITFAKRDITTSNEFRRLKYELQFDNVYTRSLEIIALDEKLNFQPNFNGNHIMELGFTGKMIKTIKEDIVNKIQNNELDNNIEVCRNYVIDNYQ